MSERLEDFALSKTISKKKGTIQKVAVIGCGSMGQEITRIISQFGMEVIYLDLTEERLAEVSCEIEKQLDEMINKWGLTEGEKRAILSRMKGTTD
jgi:3-hydroxybutyryl-CoA dehydrogenase